MKFYDVIIVALLALVPFGLSQGWLFSGNLAAARLPVFIVLMAALVYFAVKCFSIFVATLFYLFLGFLLHLFLRCGNDPGEEDRKNEKNHFTFFPFHGFMFMVTCQKYNIVEFWKLIPG